MELYLLGGSVETESFLVRSKTTVLAIAIGLVTVLAATGIVRALASAHRSPPGQQMMSVSRPTVGVASPWSSWIKSQVPTMRFGKPVKSPNLVPNFKP